jgi:phage terminase small subunit
VQESTLAAYCQSFARWVAAERLIEEHGTEIVLRDDKGNVKSIQISPQVNISGKAFDRMVKTAAQLQIKIQHGAQKSVAGLGDFANAADMFGTSKTN